MQGIIKFNDGRRDYLLYRRGRDTFGITAGKLKPDDSQMLAQEQFEGSKIEAQAFLLGKGYPNAFVMGCFSIFAADTISRKLTARECDQYRDQRFTGSVSKKAKQFFLINDQKELTPLGQAVLKLLEGDERGCAISNSYP